MARTLTRIRRRCALSTTLLATVCFLAVSPYPLSGQTIPNEYRIKAAFLYQFPQFVGWPPDAWRDAASVQICILQPNRFGRELETLIRAESLNGRPFAIKEMSGPDALIGCHLLFVSSTAPRAADVLQAARGTSVLTVGEGERFLDEGGIIALRVVERRVRFDVNISAAQKAGLRISSQLLRLALNVRGGPS